MDERKKSPKKYQCKKQVTSPFHSPSSSNQSSASSAASTATTSNMRWKMKIESWFFKKKICKLSKQTPTDVINSTSTQSEGDFLPLKTTDDLARPWEEKNYWQRTLSLTNLNLTYEDGQLADKMAEAKFLTGWEMLEKGRMNEDGRKRGLARGEIASVQEGHSRQTVYDLDDKGWHWC